MNSLSVRYEPDLWHACTDTSWPQCDLAANCYSYALNSPRNYWSQPGLGSVQTVPEPFFESFSNYFRQYTLAQYMAKILIGAKQDGLRQVSDADITDDEHYPVALYFSDGDNPTSFDMHWYRRDDNGSWSHKNGWRPVTDLDDDGELITDISTPPNRAFPVMGGIFLVPRPGIVLQKTFPMLEHQSG